MNITSLLTLFIVGLFFYILYTIFYSAFREVGFTRLEAAVIVFGSLLGGAINITLFTYQNWAIAINVGGAVIPILVSIYLLATQRCTWRALIGILIVAFFTYNVTSVSSAGVTSPFPLWLIPPAVASIFSLLSCYKRPKHAAPVAYISGTLGVLVGADLFHLPDILALPATNEVTASIGGAAIFDMVFLAGVIAVLIDGLFVGRRR
jgi:uncharacterized membrane protein